MLGEDGAVGRCQSLREPRGHVGACVCVWVCGPQVASDRSLRAVCDLEDA